MLVSKLVSLTFLILGSETFAQDAASPLRNFAPEHQQLPQQTYADPDPYYAQNEIAPRPYRPPFRPQAQRRQVELAGILGSPVSFNVKAAQKRICWNNHFRVDLTFF